MERHTIFAAAIGAGMLLVAPALAQTTPPAMISVTGEATISVPPDQAQVEAGATSYAKTARLASETNNAAVGQLLLALKAANIDQKDIQTSRLLLQPQYEPNHNPPTVVGYRASNQVTVRLRDVSKVASTIDLLVGAGATDIGGVSFTVSQASKLLDDAREQAVADARRKAEIYAKAAGVALGAPLSISEEGGSPGPVFRAKMAAAPMAATPIAQGEETLSVTVNVSWAIKQGQ
ncbi:SIMPL domain-containing protein [Bradyrhizobium canariense]|uniref:SIMPL domain-containing protein n=1 Tax=Bradyrhizobium canariense TaxID=255045 RepID=A0A1H1YUV8_9BRAD|nr:SIMPL domain-containing protein [Bradyrhizobium canariense]SDT25180.1 hypothetical protein SAMN05444158_5029 [Bradyrhizobium canariense]